MPRGRPKKLKDTTPETIYVANKKEAKEPENTSFRDLFKLDESYTSLLLGIIVVIVAAVLFVSLFKNQNFFKPNPKQDIATQQIGPTLSPEETQAPSTQVDTSPTPSALPTHAPTTAQKLPKPTVSPTPTQTGAPKTNQGMKTYVVKSGDDLWTIALQIYNDGYKWTQIATANNLADPNTLHVGDKLTLPQINSDAPSLSEKGTPVLGSPQTKVTSYTVMHGDNLWNIAVTVYGDGYQWTKIAAANNLARPSVIHAGNTLKIP